jgi:CRISPR-associated endonuclease Cas1
MLDDHTTAWEAVPIRGGIVVLSGYGVRVRVARRHLIVEDGFGLERRTARFAKAPARLRRLVILGHTGFVTLEALRWLADSKAALIVVDADGAVIAATAPQRINDPRLRRLQALAVGTATGAAITRDLLTDKVEGQREVLSALGVLSATTAGVFAELLGRLAVATSIDECLRAEAAAAVLYFRSWKGVLAPRFARHELAAMPEHWRAFKDRSSDITGTPRAATDPINALLNYLYALLEAETRVALLTFGLDPGLGFAHVDVSNRESLALDVMEAARPDVDAWLIEFLDARPFRLLDFVEERDGRCRLTPDLAHELAESVGRWRSAIAPIVERVVDRINAADAALSVTVAITPRKASPGITRLSRPRPRTRIETTVDRRRKHESNAKPQRLCPECRAPLSGKRCKQCRFAPVGTDDVGADRQRAIMMQRQRTNRDWSGPKDDRNFKRDILPGLQGVTLRRIMEATGLSKRFASQIRRGLALPHYRHWDSLASLSQADACEAASSIVV